MGFIYEFGDKISMTTFRDINAAGDVTRWLRDEATGLVTNKVYADGKGPRYDYTPDGKLATRTWARGIVTTYSYDDNGSLTNTVYSDGTPTISLAYNRAGRQIQAIDAAGTTTFAYNAFGSLTNESVIGVAGTNTIERFYDSFGRNAGYALNGLRQSTLSYDPTTGRLASMQIPPEQSNNPNNQTIKQFTWNYLAGSDLKSSLAYPNGLAASWQYDANSQLLQVKNAFPTNTISQYDYIYDAAGRRISVSKSGSAFTQDDLIAYGYNSRRELTNAVAAVDSDYRYAYDFDDIGNRESSFERGTNSVYTSNNLNQYTAVDNFAPQFDDDGNQTLIKTSTGIWSVTYNGENRPILWENVYTNSPTPNSSTPTLISMSFDRMGRRVMKNDLRFVYDGYLQIANFKVASTNSQLTTHNLQLFIWDPTELVATRPLVWNRDTSAAYYTHDGNKNVSAVVYENGETSAHYEYAPFGEVRIVHGECASANPWRFSSEYAEDDTGTVYYNYRHYEPIVGRWFNRDPIGEVGGWNVYSYVVNRPMSIADGLGLSCCIGEKRIVAFIYEDASSISRGNPNFDNLRELLKNLEILNYIQLGAAGATGILDGLIAGAGKGVTSVVSSGSDYIAGDQSSPDGGGAVDAIARLYDKLKSFYPKLRGKLYYQECEKRLFFWTHWADKVVGPSEWIAVDINGIDQANPIKTYDEAKTMIDNELLLKFKELLGGGKQ